ncbi:MAG: HaeII family restriction endonuclease, partial [Hyphomicrobium sp.]
MADTTTELLLIRHAPSLNGGRLAGRRDVPADCSDRPTFVGLQAAIGPVQHRIVSPALRCMQTAAALWPGMPVPETDVRLWEQDFGDWEGVALAAMPDLGPLAPEALAALGDHNKSTNGEVEVYIYRMFEAKVSSIGAILALIRKATTETFDLAALVETFERKPGLKRSIDKVFEITVYALFSTVVRALRLQVSLTVGHPDPKLVDDFGDFLEKVVGLKKGTTSLVLDASLFRL